MISVFIKIIFMIYIVLSILEIRNIHVYNLNSNLVTMEENINKQNIQSQLENLSPLLLKNTYTHEITHENLLKDNPGYMINDEGKLISLKELTGEFHIYENDKIVNDLNVNTDQIFNIFENKITVNRRSYLSLYGESVQSVLLKTFNNMTCYTCSSNFVFYLFNPKHFHDILGKDLHKIKKWAIKVELEKGDILSLPSEWNYIYEGKGNLLKTTFDNVFSVGYNLLRK